MHTHNVPAVIKESGPQSRKNGKNDTPRGKSGVKVCAFINKTNLLSRDGLMARDSQECIISYFLSPNKANALNGCVKDIMMICGGGVVCIE